MITIVTIKDYYDIKKIFTEEEIKQKYGKLIVMKEEEYKEHLKKIKE